MKATILILSKTQMNNEKACVGGISLDGQRYVRLLDENGNNQPQNTSFQPKQAWEIEYKEKLGNVPPHIEDIIVLNKVSKGKLKSNMTLKDFLQKRKIPIWYGSPDELFDGLIQFTESGSGYIDKIKGIPKHSVGFWISDKNLKRNDYNNNIRYQYPIMHGWRSIKFKGYDEPVDIIPAGTLLRVSLARWVTFDEKEEPKCWLQLSGWYDLGLDSDHVDDFLF